MVSDRAMTDTGEIFAPSRKGASDARLHEVTMRSNVRAKVLRRLNTAEQESRLFRPGAPRRFGDRTERMMRLPVAITPESRTTEILPIPLVQVHLRSTISEK